MSIRNVNTGHIIGDLIQAGDIGPIHIGGAKPSEHPGVARFTTAVQHRLSQINQDIAASGSTDVLEAQAEILREILDQASKAFG